jgi:hypothetical protein
MLRPLVRENWSTRHVAAVVGPSVPQTAGFSVVDCVESLAAVGMAVTVGLAVME